jgi:predicted alpha/beta hydrolase
MIEPVDHAIPSLDGQPLAATLFEPEGDPATAVIVSPATGTPRGFYRAFCSHLAERGAAVVTYDYRGTGQPPQELRRSKARMRDWGERDFPGVIRWMRDRYPAVDLHAVGHSVGGHVLLMAANNAEIARAVTVASQSGYWRLYRGFERYRVFAFVKAIMPILTHLLGYFPGSRVAFGVDLAPGVLYEWSRWCTSPGYFFDDATLESLRNARTYTAPTRMIGLSDDPWATPRAIDALQVGFVATPVDRVEIVPEREGLGDIGHMGFFRARNATCWRYVTEFLSIGGSPA